MAKQKVLFLIIFIVLSLIVFQIPISGIIGSDQNFTLFELIAPLGGMFLGPFFGALSAFIVRGANIIITQQTLDFLTVMRFLPMMLAAVYFGMKGKKMAIIFPICIILFLVHPIGQQAWLFPLIWLIPLAATFGKKRLILNSLGATFTAHAVGSTIFLYAFGLTPQIWLALIPVVFIERGFFTIGIWASYLVMNTVLDKLTAIKGVHILRPLVNKNYLISPRFFKSHA
ncbi:MAG TPA: hypothetical protein ENI19_03215 [Candidatus Nealsonbacteria bacterium]|uniref:ECF transporter S component n=1 Tax=marine sediment metagenome TaxID=412755 RepID=A0A0F9VF63_9ZZZZ|nr:hypothetical protein [Candidatus Nealsonbacteria bacterium]HEB46689.1 hypothetical protein [Candidatus Nealsonbacteria bacterium]